MSFPDLADFNNLAGLAALVNSLIMWPQIRALKAAVEELRTMHKEGPRGRVRKIRKVQRRPR